MERYGRIITMLLNLMYHKSNEAFIEAVDDVQFTHLCEVE